MVRQIAHDLAFRKWIDKFWDRQLLKEGVRDALKPQFTKLVGRCHKCGSDIGTSGKFCPGYGVSLL